MKYIFSIITVLVFSSIGAVAIITSPTEALQGNYSCPEGQTAPNPQFNQDIRYCYAVCPPGQFFEIPAGQASYAGAKCYSQEKDSSGRHIVAGDADFENKQARVSASQSDGMKCPDGSYRGGILSGQDEAKCYVCTSADCKEEQGQPLVPSYYDACLNSIRSCHRAQERAQEKYIEKIRSNAPNGFTLPGSGDTVRGATIAQTFCKYYKNMTWVTQYDTEYTYQSCIIGYEVGFGKGDICSKPYLFGHYATHRPASTANAEAAREYIKNQPRAIRDLVINDGIKACLDGWAQYSVDYWWCDGRQSCIEPLREDSSRVIDPGPRPNKKQYIDEDGEVVEVHTNVVTSQSCGSVQTAFFACNVGRGLQNSSFWQIIQVILNILIGLIGIAAVGGLVYGAVRYSSAGDNAEQVNAAKTIIKNVIIGLVLFLAMWALIQYVIPGGIFSSP